MVPDCLPGTGHDLSESSNACRVQVAARRITQCLPGAGRDLAGPFNACRQQQGH